MSRYEPEHGKFRYPIDWEDHLDTLGDETTELFRELCRPVMEAAVKRELANIRSRFIEFDLKEMLVCAYPRLEDESMFGDVEIMMELDTDGGSVTRYDSLFTELVHTAENHEDVPKAVEHCISALKSVIQRLEDRDWGRLDSE